MKIRTIVLAGLLAVAPVAANAQGFVLPNGNGGYIVMQPSQPPAWVTPHPFDKGFTITQPGIGVRNPWVDVNPSGGGGYTVGPLAPAPSHLYRPFRNGEGE